MSDEPNYDTYPAVDADGNFPPSIRAQAVQSPELTAYLSNKFETLFVDDSTYTHVGDTSDDQAWQRAVNAAILGAASGKTYRIYGSKSAYYFANPVNYAGCKNVIFEGSGKRNTIIYVKPGALVVGQLFTIPKTTTLITDNVSWQYLGFNGGMISSPSGPQRDGRVFGTDYANTAILANGSLVAGIAPEPLNGVIKHIDIYDCWFYGFKSLPILIRGCTDVRVERNWFERNLDPGFTFNDGVSFIDNVSLYSGDNGVSLSRGNSHVIATNNRIKYTWYAGMMAGGFGGDVGPTDVLIANNLIVDAGTRGIDCTESPTYVSILDNRIMGVRRGRVAGSLNDDLGNGIHFEGQDPVTAFTYTTFAAHIIIQGNTIDTPDSMGIRLGGVVDIKINNNSIRNVGSAFAADGVTAIIASNNQRNIGIGSPASTGNTVTLCDVSNNTIIDDRGGSALMNFPVRGHTFSATWYSILNTNSGARNSYVEVFADAVYSLNLTVGQNGGSGATFVLNAAAGNVTQVVHSRVGTAQQKAIVDGSNNFVEQTYIAGVPTSMRVVANGAAANAGQNNFNRPVGLPLYSVTVLHTNTTPSAASYGAGAIVMVTDTHELAQSDGTVWRYVKNNTAV